MKRWVIGDIHGAHLALEQVFDISGFDPKEDRLICLGDVADGWPGVKQCFDMLLEVEDLVYIIGNHDIWFRDFLNGHLMFHDVHGVWLPQGGNNTVRSYVESGEPIALHNMVPQSHKDLLNNAKKYHTEKVGDELHCFVHGGFHPREDPEDMTEYDLAWDRTLAHGSPGSTELFDHVYIGHTAHRLGYPMTTGGVTNMDTGAGWSGRLSIMDIDSRTSWMSDKVADMYPEEAGRR